MSKTDRTFLTIFPREVRDMVYKFVIGDQVIHIKSDVILDKSDSEDDEHDDHESNDGKDDKSNDGKDDESKVGEDDGSDHGEEEESNEESNADEDDESGEDDDSDDDEGGWHEEEEEEEELPAELLEVFNGGRGPLYHSTCNNELLHPKDAKIYRIRSVEASRSKASRVQSNMVIQDFRNVNYQPPRLSDPNLEYETIGIPGEEEEDKPPVQLKLAFLRVNKQIYEEASQILYSTRTFGFDDATTFAQFFSINYIPMAEPPTPITGTNLLVSKRNDIRSIHIRAKTALSLSQKIKWMKALDAATFVLPLLEKIRVLFDLSHEKMGRFVDRTFWQYWRHEHGFPLLKSAEVSVAVHLEPFWIRQDAQYESFWEFRDVTWKVDFLEAIIGYHMDILFGASLLDSASVAKRDAVFAETWVCFS